MFDTPLLQEQTQKNESSQIVDAIFDATPVLIAYMDRDLNFVRVNRSYANADNKAPEYFPGKNHFELYPNKDNEKIFKRVIESGESYTATAKPFDYERSPERGTTHWDWTLTPVKDSADTVIGVVLSLLDVTNHVKMGNELFDHRTRLQGMIEQATSDLRDSLKEKEILLQEVHHRVKNNLAMVSAFLRLQMNKEAYPPVVNALQSCDNRIQTMSMVHKKLYQSSDIASVDMHDFFQDLVDALYIPDEHGDLNFIVDIDDIKLGMDVAIPCALVINELLTNSLKYAFTNADQLNAKISLSMKKSANGQYSLEFSDNGCGIPIHTDFEKPDTMGLQLIRLFANQLDGDISLDRAGGTRWHLSFSV